MTQNSNTPQNKKELSRREALKALAALGGAVTATSLLPEKWSRPEIGVGVLPAHAQNGSQCVPPYVFAMCNVVAYWVNVEVDFQVDIEVQLDPPCPAEIVIDLIFLDWDNNFVGAYSVTVMTDANGHYAGSETFFAQNFQGWPETVQWTISFLNPADGTDTCSGTSPITWAP